MFLLGIGSTVLGVVLTIIWNVVSAAYFRGRTLPDDVSVGDREDVVATESVEREKPVD